MIQCFGLGDSDLWLLVLAPTLGLISLHYLILEIMGANGLSEYLASGRPEHRQLPYIPLILNSIRYNNPSVLHILVRYQKPKPPFVYSFSQPALSNNNILRNYFQYSVVIQ